jgi:phosphate transport system ATP-binding protein
MGSETGLGMGSEMGLGVGADTGSGVGADTGSGMGACSTALAGAAAGAEAGSGSGLGSRARSAADGAAGLAGGSAENRDARADGGFDARVRQFAGADRRDRRDRRERRQASDRRQGAERRQDLAGRQVFEARRIAAPRYAGHNAGTGINAEAAGAAANVPALAAALYAAASKAAAQAADGTAANPRASAAAPAYSDSGAKMAVHAGARAGSAAAEIGADGFSAGSAIGDKEAGANAPPTAAMASAALAAAPAAAQAPAESAYVRISGLNVFFGDKQALRDVSVGAAEGSIHALIGPSGCGKTTLLRCLNRLNDFTPSFRLTGDIAVGGRDIYGIKSKREIQELRQGMGMIFQRPAPLGMSVMRNMLFPYLEHYRAPKRAARELALEKLRLVGLLDELSGRLDGPAERLSGGQQQRLCIARALMLDAKLLLLDEPCSSLDPISTYKIEDLLAQLKGTRTIIMVTHNLEQARRISDFTSFFYDGRVVESAETLRMFAHPQHELTQKYVRGAF